MYYFTIKKQIGDGQVKTLEGTLKAAAAWGKNWRWTGLRDRAFTVSLKDRFEPVVK